MGMSAHILFDAIDPLPATLSPRMIDIMRRKLAFDGLLMTDDLSMEALPGTISTRAMGRSVQGLILFAPTETQVKCNLWFEQPTLKTRQRMQAAIGA